MSLQKEFTINLSGSRRLIFDIINKYCSNFPEYIKDDIFQDVALGAWKGYDNFRGDCKFISWIGRITQFTCIDYLRRAKAGIKTIALDNVFYELEQDLPYYEPSLSVLDTLSNIERKTIDLYIEGKSYKEISAIMEEPENKLRVRVNRIKERLKRRVAEMELE
jgi:RNA polymerase sigma-70 factor (ECF subfamily)